MMWEKFGNIYLKIDPQKAFLCYQKASTNFIKKMMFFLNDAFPIESMLILVAIPTLHVRDIQHLVHGKDAHLMNQNNSFL